MYKDISVAASGIQYICYPIQGFIISGGGGYFPGDMALY